MLTVNENACSCRASKTEKSETAQNETESLPQDLISQNKYKDKYKRLSLIQSYYICFFFYRFSHCNAFM